MRKVGLWQINRPVSPAGLRFLQMRPEPEKKFGRKSGKVDPFPECLVCRIYFFGLQTQSKSGWRNRFKARATQTFFFLI
jgi:hypothetical protein